MALRFDTIGSWSEIKLEIIKKYALAYSRLLYKFPRLYHIYIDAFAGAGVHVSKATGDIVPGSPLNALEVQPPFREYHLIELNVAKVANLKHLIDSRPEYSNRYTHLYVGDCNDVLQQIIPTVRYKDYRRALCLLDPYGLHLKWSALQLAGGMQTVDIFLNFPIMDMNRNALWQNPDHVDEVDIARMDDFWGDSSWRSIAYQKRNTLFGEAETKLNNDVIAAAFRQRLISVAGFKYVPEPLAMRNSRGATVYYLFFASHNPTANKIVEDILRKYRGPSQEKMTFE